MLSKINNNLKKYIKKPLDTLIKLTYPNTNGEESLKIFCSVFFMQKIVGFNRLTPWPTHFTSKIISRKRMTLGKRTFPGWSPYCYIQARNGIIIGSNLRMGPNCSLISANHDTNNYDNHLPSPPIKIGDNVWLGAGTIVLPGVSIGDNVVIGAGSIVTKNIPSNLIACGNPCKPLRTKEPYKGRDYNC